MAVGISQTLANELLDAIGNNGSYAVAQAYAKLHTGDPGAAGTSNAATETTRKAISFGAAASGVMSNDAAIEWTNLPTGDPDDYTHISIWDHVSAGNFLWSGAVTANAVSDGDTFTIPIGELDLTFGLAS